MGTSSIKHMGTSCLKRWVVLYASGRRQRKAWNKGRRKLICLQASGGLPFRGLAAEARTRFLLFPTDRYSHCTGKLEGVKNSAAASAADAAVAAEPSISFRSATKGRTSSDPQSRNNKTTGTGMELQRLNSFVAAEDEDPSESLLAGSVFRNRDSILSIGWALGLCVAMLFVSLVHELLIHDAILKLESEIWVNAIVRTPVIFVVLLWGWTGALAACRWYEFDVEGTLGLTGDPNVKIIRLSSVFRTALAATAVLLADILAHIHDWNVPHTATAVVLSIVAMDPLTLLSKDRRFTLLEATWRIFSPFGKVTFREVLIADVMTSLSKSLLDIQLLFCAMQSTTVTTVGVIHNPTLFQECFNVDLSVFIMCLPYLLRFRQCITQFINTLKWANVYNAIKYLTSLPVIALSAAKAADPTNTNLRMAWLCAAIVNSTYGWVWDCVMDWGLWDFRRGVLPGLRPNIRLPPIAYYAAMVFDLGLRFAWVLSLSQSFVSLDRELSLFVFELLEVLRRCVWIIFRVEWEHHCVLATQLMDLGRGVGQGSVGSSQVPL